MNNTDQILQKITSKISIAATQGDFDLVTQLTKNAKRIQEIVATQAALEAELTQIGISITAEKTEVQQPVHVVRRIVPDQTIEDMIDEMSAGDVSVTIDFPKLGINRSLTKISERMASKTLRKTIEVLAETMGTDILEKLSRLRVSRGPLVSNNPERDYLNHQTGALYAHHRIGRTQFHVLTHSATHEKVAALKEVAKTLDIPQVYFLVKHTP